MTSQGNYVGMTEAEMERADPRELSSKIDNARNILYKVKMFQIKLDTLILFGLHLNLSTAIKYFITNSVEMQGRGLHYIARVRHCINTVYILCVLAVRTEATNSLRCIT